MSHSVGLLAATAPVPPGLCEAVQGHICHMAADVPLSVAATAVARHVRECTRCDEFVDELGRLRRWLEAARSPRQQLEQRGLGTAAGERHFERCARRALARELLARLARDLLALGRGQTCRPLEARAKDVGRLATLIVALGDAPGGTPEEAAAVQLALSEAPLAPEVALKAAFLLDPLGLDIALALLSCLERLGQSVYAHQLTDQMLARLA